MSKRFPVRGCRQPLPYLNWMFVVAFACDLCACGGNDAAFAPSTDPHALLQSVQLTEHAYNLSTSPPYDTARLHAVATLADGTPAALQIRYTSNDNAVYVDSTGAIQVKGLPVHQLVDQGVSGYATIVVAATLGKQTRRDSVKVHVTPGVPEIPERLSLSKSKNVDGLPAGSWSDPQVLKWPTLNLGGEAAYFTENASRDTIAPILALPASSDTTVAAVGFFGDASPLIRIYPRDTGRAWVKISAYAYGKTLRDSIPITVGTSRMYGIRSVRTSHLTAAGVTRALEFAPDSLDVPAGSDVIWKAPHECAYDDPTSPVDGGTDFWGQPSRVNPACHGPAIDITFDDSVTQYVLASRIPPAFGTTLDVFFSNFAIDDGVFAPRIGKNDHGGSGNIGTFQNIEVPPDVCSYVFPVNCINDAAEARLFMRPGRYAYRVKNGVPGIKGATGVLIVH